MNKIYYASIFASMFYTIFSSPLCAMDPDKYSTFEGITTNQYVSKCMPKLPPDKVAAALEIINSLVNSKTTPIQEDDYTADTGKEITEGGFSFPIKLKIQGPFWNTADQAHLNVFLILDREVEMILSPLF